MKQWMLTILVLALILPVSAIKASATPTYADIKGHWAESAINEAIRRGIISGVSNEKFAPDAAITYEQFMIMLAKLLTQNNLIKDRVSGCKLLLTNYNEELAATKGDLKKLNEYRENYLKDKPAIKDKMAQYSSRHVSNYNKSGECNLRSWTNYKYDTFYTWGKPSAPYSPNYIDLSKLDYRVRPALTTVPYIAGFLDYYDFVNNENNIKDFDFMAYKEGVKEEHLTEYYTNEYFRKRITKLYDLLNIRYLNPAIGKINKPLLREDASLILYSFLNYKEQKLVEYNQDFFYYLDYSNNENPWKNQDIKYKKFKSSYTDIPKYFQVDSMGGKYASEKDMYYYYRPERVKPTKENFLKIYKGEWVKTNGSSTDYEYSTQKSLINLTSRGIILAVSDAGLLGSSSTKFNPEKALTRAEAVAAALKLEKFIKSRYDFEKVDPNDKSYLIKQELAGKLLKDYFVGIEQQSVDQIKAVVNPGSYPADKITNLLRKNNRSNYIVKDIEAHYGPSEDVIEVTFNMITKTLGRAHLEEYYYSEESGNAIIRKVNGSWKLSEVTHLPTNESYKPSAQDVFHANPNNDKEIVVALIKQNNSFLDQKNTAGYLSIFENPASQLVSYEQDFTYSIESISNVKITDKEATADVQRKKQLVVKRSGNSMAISDSYMQSIKMSWIKVNDHWKIRSMTITKEDKI